MDYSKTITISDNGHPKDSPSAIEPMDDKLHRLAYACTQSIGSEVASRCEKAMSNPTELLVSSGQSYVAGTLLGALNNLPGRFKCLAGMAGAGMAFLSMREELSPERLANIGSTTQSIWDSKENMDAKVFSMQKSLAPAVIDVGSLVLGVLTGKRLQKRAQNDQESPFDFEWRMDGYETKRLKFDELLGRLLSGRKCEITITKHLGDKFCLPWSARFKEHQLYKKLSDAQKFYGAHSLAAAEQRSLLSGYYNRRGLTKEADYQLQKAERITNRVLSELDAGKPDGTMELLRENYNLQVRQAKKHFSQADKINQKADRLNKPGSQKLNAAAKLYEQAALHYKTGLQIHPGERKLVQTECSVNSRLERALFDASIIRRETGDLASAYVALKQMATTHDGKIDYRNAESLAKLCHKMKFHDEAEQLYRGIYKKDALVPRDSDGNYWYTSEQRDALKGITRCLVERGKFAEAKQLGTQLKKLGSVNDRDGGGWGSLRWGEKNKDTVEAINQVLFATRKFSRNSEFANLPITAYQ